jgi:fibronectin type 3 domain-containing protein
MKILKTLILLLTLTTSFIKAADVTLAWDPVQDTNVIGYKVYWGASSRSYYTNQNAGLVTTNIVSGLVVGATYYFAATSYALNGLESDFSNEVVYTVPGTNPPSATLTSIAITPTNQTIQVGQTLQFSAVGLYSDSTSSNLSPTWSSLPLDVSTINSSGLATAIGAGTSTITATVGQITGNTSLSVTNLPVVSGTYSLYSNNVPPIVDGGADSPVTLGVKFRSSAAGLITAVRYYKSPANIGPHIVSVWSNSGSLLASKTNTPVSSASGWQQADLTTPISILPNTDYVVSYCCQTGHYSVETGYYSIARTYGPLSTALNAGVYTYGSGNLFPTSSWNSASYFIDFILSTAIGAPINLVTNVRLNEQ